jgi:hypothetical protein
MRDFVSQKAFTRRCVRREVSGSESDVAAAGERFRAQRLGRSRGTRVVVNAHCT